jgi:hypothetical protein
MVSWPTQFPHFHGFSHLAGGPDCYLDRAD